MQLKVKHKEKYFARKKNEKGYPGTFTLSNMPSTNTPIDSSIDHDSQKIIHFRQNSKDNDLIAHAGSGNTLRELHELNSNELALNMSIKDKDLSKNVIMNSVIEADLNDDISNLAAN